MGWLASFFPHLICDKAVECAPKTCNVASGVETIAVSPAVSISVIGLIIDASIPAGAGHGARNTAVAETRRRQTGEGRHLECYGCSGLPVGRRMLDEVCHTCRHTEACVRRLVCRLLTYIYDA